MEFFECFCKYIGPFVFFLVCGSSKSCADQTVR